MTSDEPATQVPFPTGSGFDGSRPDTVPVRVLIVEDNPGDVSLIRMALREGGSDRSEVASVGSLADALTSLAEPAFDCVVLDLGLPDADGLESLEAILALRPGQAVVVLTGRSDEDLAREAVRRGAQDYLRKSDDYGRELAHVVGYAVERARAQRWQRRLALLLQRSSEVVVVLSTTLEVTYASRSFEDVLGVAADAILGRRLDELVSIADPTELGSLEQTLEALAAGERVAEPISVKARHADGTPRWLDVTPVDLRRDPAVDGVALMARDVTERRLAEEAIAYLAYHDHRTRLPNRVAMIERLGHALERAAEVGGSRVAFAVLDVDDFKVVTDALGHAVGDAIVEALAARLQTALYPTEALGLFEGDSFVVVVDRVSAPETCDDLPERIAAVLADPITVAQGPFRVAMSGGWAVARPGEEAEQVIRHANIAVHHAKSTARGTIVPFDDALEVATARRHTLEVALAEAVEREELGLVYQPVLELAGGATVGFEALLRWTHPELGAIRPDEFIPIAEQTGLIIPIGRWVLDRAIAQLAEWRELEPGRPLFVAVNISARQLGHPDVVEQVRAALGRGRVPASAVHLEVTESVLMESVERSVEVLHALRGLGCSLSIDDFGTGYSSLSYLKRLPIDTLKIDRTFVDGLGEDLSDTSIVQAVIALAQALHLQVLAEGVETETHLCALRRLGCELGQGFLWSPGLPPDQARAWLAATAPPVASVDRAVGPRQ